MCSSEGWTEASPLFESVMATVGRMVFPDFRGVHVGRERELSFLVYEYKFQDAHEMLTACSDAN